MKLIVDNITPFSEDLGHFKDALALANISIEPASAREAQIRRELLPEVVYGNGLKT
jgi:hypothetical protein